MHSRINSERRQSERIQCVMKASYRMHGRRTNAGETRDISDGGVLLMVSGKIKKNDLLELEIPLGGGSEPLKTRGRVMHTRQEKIDGGTANLAGVAFLKLDEQQQQAIGRAIWHQILKDSTRFGRA